MSEDRGGEKECGNKQRKEDVSGCELEEEPDGEVGRGARSDVLGIDAYPRHELVSL